MVTSLISTWIFSRAGVETALNAQSKKPGSALDAVEVGIRVVEEDPSVTSVGYGGLPNALGQLQLDAALMTSDGSQGAVMAITGIRAAIPVARLVLDHSPHAILCSEGALSFAKCHGVSQLSSDALLTPHARKRYDQFCRGEEVMEPWHNNKSSKDTINKDNLMRHSDTVGMLARDASGRLAAGCATSGLQFKHDGRVGDSPVFGAGLYADEYGAASATGDGDRMLRHCLSFLAVERLRAGDDPTSAARYAIRRLVDKDPTCQAAIITLDAAGQTGAAATHDGFTTITWNQNEGLRTNEISGEVPAKWKHSCV